MLRTIAALSALGILLLALAPAAPVPKAPPKPEPHYYYPTVVGDTWETDKGAMQTVTAVEKKGEAVLVTVDYKNPKWPLLKADAITYRVSEDGVYQQGNPGDPNAAVPPYGMLRLPLAPGVPYEVGRCGAVKTNYGPEEVTVGAGTFRAVRVVEEAVDDKTGNVVRTTLWYAPRVGQIKLTDVLIVGGKEKTRIAAEMAKFTPGAGSPLTPSR